MNINRHNYETFFLLYVDKELSAADSKAVDMFVTENPDLKMELDILMQTTLTADQVMFDNKAALLKEEEITALQQNLLLYLDNELSPGEFASTEKLINTDNTVKAQLDLLQQTKLQPETILFADKRSLYRKEGGKVVFLNWKKIAAAAILLGIGIWTALTFIKSDKPGNKTETIAKGNEEKLPANKAADKTTTLQPVITTNNDDEKNTASSKENNNTQSSTQKNIPPDNKEPKPYVIAPENQNNTVVKKETTNEPKPSNNLPKPLQNFNTIQSNQNDVVIVRPENNNSGNKKIVDPVNQIENPTKTSLTEPATNAYAINAAFTNNNAGEQNEDGILMVNNEKVKKTKLGGFLRKVKRLVERTTNIKTGNGIKVAGFDIAIK